MFGARPTLRRSIKRQCLAWTALNESKWLKRDIFLDNGRLLYLLKTDFSNRTSHAALLNVQANIPLKNAEASCVWKKPLYSAPPWRLRFIQPFFAKKQKAFSITVYLPRFPSEFTDNDWSHQYFSVRVYLRRSAHLFVVSTTPSGRLRAILNLWCK